MASEPRPVTSVFMAEVGSRHLADTYLTPLRYKGWGMSMAYEGSQAMRFDPQRWMMRFDVRARWARTLNPARSALMYQLDLAPQWAMMRRFDLTPSLGFAAGPCVGAVVGVRYLPRNGNNPAQAQGAVNIGLTGHAIWKTRLWRLPLSLRYQPALALLGAFFSPDYDELYYEIWLGNHSGLCHLGWPGSYFSLDNLLTADIHFGHTTLRLGYRCDVLSTRAAGITTRDISHSLVVGVAFRWVTLSAR